MKALNTIIVLITILMCGIVVAQGNEVIVITNANRSVEPAERLTENPKIVDTVFSVPNIKYPLLSINYEPYFDLQPIAPASVHLNQKLPQLYKGYAKIGIGSILMPLAEVYYNNTRSRKLSYGFHTQHLSSWGNMRDVAPSTFDRTSVRGFVGVTEKKYDWSTEATYKNKGLHFYGFPNENANADSIAQRFNTLSVKGMYASHVHDSLGINWKAGLEYRHFNDKKPLEDSLRDWNTAENFIALNASATMKWGSELFFVDADVKWNGYNYGLKGDTLSPLYTGIANNNTMVSLRPGIITYLKNKRLKAKVGVDITVAALEKTKVYLYPKIEVKYSMFDDILIPYLLINGGLNHMTFRDLAETNEFLLSNVEIRNENTALEGTIGIKGTLSKRVGFNVSANFAHLRDKALFVNDTLYNNYNRFNVIYDTMNRSTIEGSLSYQFKEKTKIDLIGRYYSYNVRNNIYAWNLPQVQFILRGTYNLYDKFIFTADISLEGGRKTKVYENGDDVIAENNQYVLALGFIADANLGVEYRYNKRVSGFLNFNNLAAQQYQRWYHYPVQGFQVMLGATLRF